MTDVPALSNGFFRAAYHNAQVTTLYPRPILQVVAIRRIPANTSNSGNGVQSDRFRLMVSDGSYSNQALVGLPMNPKILVGDVGKFSIIRIENYQCNHIKDKPVLVLLDFVPVGNPQEKVGDPKQLEQAARTGELDPPHGASAAGTGGNGFVATSNGRQARQNVPPPHAGAQVASTPSAENIDEIRTLTSFSQNWTIKARVVSKGDIRTYTNSRGEGRLFNVVFLDNSGEIRATGFNEAVEQFYNTLEKGKVYFVSGLTLKPRNKQFNQTNHDYEMTFENRSKVQQCLEAQGPDLPRIRYSFVPLDQLREVQEKGVCDVMGIVQEVQDISTVVMRTTQKELKKREVTIADMSGWAVRLTLWASEAENFRLDPETHPVLAIKGARVSDFGGRSLSTTQSSLIAENPDIPEAHTLIGWYAREGVNRKFEMYSGGQSGTGGTALPSQRYTLQQVRDGQHELTSGAVYYTFSAHIGRIMDRSLTYPACPTPTCQNKKLLQGDVGQADIWTCARCDHRFDEPNYRYVLTVVVADHSHELYVNFFNEHGERLLGMDANAFESLGPDEKMFALREAASVPVVMKVRGKNEVYQEQSRAKYTVMEVTILDGMETDEIRMLNAKLGMPSS